MDYFDAAYVSGAFLTVITNGQIRFKRTPPRFQPELWIFHAATNSSGERTNYVCESCRNGFRYLVGHDNPWLWVLLGCLQKQNAMVDTGVYRLSKSESVEKRMRKKTASYHQTLKILFEQYADGSKQMHEFMQRVGHQIRLGHYGVVDNKY